MAELILPSLGEGIEKGTIISIMVQVGDTITQEQPLIEVETDKVVVEVPSDAEGTITEILVNIGDEIAEGTAFIKTEGNGSVPVSPVIKEEMPLKKEASPKKEEIQTKTEVDVLVSEPIETAPKAAKVVQDVATEQVSISSNGNFRASPLARKLAREIGVDIAAVQSIVPHGRISVKDVKAYSRKVHQNGTSTSPIANVALPDFSKWGTISKQPMPAITQATSKNMSMTWSQIPHAWLQEKVDVTGLETKRQLHKGKVKEEGGALTITSILVKIVAKALEEFPIFNTSLNTQTNEIIFKEYINVGVAVDSERGLLVPVLRDANKKGMLQISKDLVALSQKVKQKKATPQELEGGTFTISNLGGIGTSAIFPLVNHPQAAILGVAASSVEAIWIDGKFEPRTIMPLTIGFDHRIINGADAARFLKYVKELLEDCFLWGM